MPHHHPVVDRPAYLESGSSDMRDIKAGVPYDLCISRSQQDANSCKIGSLPGYRECSKRLKTEPNPVDALESGEVVLVDFGFILFVAFPGGFDVECDGQARPDSLLSPL